jgi:hypothetical protein
MTYEHTCLFIDDGKKCKCQIPLNLSLCNQHINSNVDEMKEKRLVEIYDIIQKHDSIFKNGLVDHRAISRMFKDYMTQNLWAMWERSVLLKVEELFIKHPYIDQNQLSIIQIRTSEAFQKRHELIDAEDTMNLHLENREFVMEI